MNFEELNSGEGISKFADYFEPRQLIGQGAFGQVVLATDRKTGQECAVKIILKKTFNLDEIERLKKEYQILSSLDHPNIVKFLSVKETKRRVLLVMEYLRGGTLKDLIHYRYDTLKNGFTDEEASVIMKNILGAVDYMHSKGIFHRDLKPENILIGDRDDFSTIKIADFGLSAQFFSEGSTHVFNQQCGTLAFMSPELAHEKFYTKEVDVWSCGIMMYILLVGKHPLLQRRDDTHSFLKKLINPKWDLDNPKFSILAKNLFLKLVHLESQERYSAGKALAHPWITRRFQDEIPLSAHEMMQFYEHQQTFRRMVKALCFFVHLTKGKNIQKQITPEYRELVAKISEETGAKKHQESSNSKSSSKHLLEGLLGTKSANPLQSTAAYHTPSKNSVKDAYFENPKTFSKGGVTSLVLGMLRNRTSESTDLGKLCTPSKRIKSLAENLSIEDNCKLRPVDQLQTSMERLMLTEQKHQSQFQGQNVHKRRKSEMSLGTSELNINTPEPDPLLKETFKIRSSKNADEVTKEKERGTKPFFRREQNLCQEEGGTANKNSKVALNCLDQEKGQITKALLRKRETPENNFNQAYHTRSPNVNLKNDILGTPLSEGENKISNIPDTAHHIAGVNESNFRKSLLFKVKAARDTQVPGNSQERRQLPSTSAHQSDYPRNETPTTQLSPQLPYGLLDGIENRGCSKTMSHIQSNKKPTPAIKTPMLSEALIERRKHLRENYHVSNSNAMISGTSRGESADFYPKQNLLLSKSKKYYFDYTYSSLQKVKDTPKDKKCIPKAPQPIDVKIRMQSSAQYQRT